MELVVVEVKLTPKGEQPKAAVYLDDFTLLSRKDGQRSQPLSPSQLAGKGALVVRAGGMGGGGGGFGTPRQGPIIGGIPGVGDRPRRVGGDDTNAGGAAPPEQASARIDDGSNEKDNPLLQVLKDKVLKEGEATDTTSGLLYFILDGKLPKPKDLALLYKSREGRLVLDFK
jgi:hypothetical protein